MTPAPSPAPSVPPARIMSVDALRGFDMFWIIGAASLVRAFQEMGDNALTRFLAQQLEHAKWEGLTAYDVIYPLFLFLIGVSMVYSLGKSIGRDPKPVIVGRILRRGLILYALNFIYNGGFSTKWPDMRVVSGVLAMIAACYVLSALLYVFVPRLKALAAVTVAVLLGYWALFLFVPFPDIKLEPKTVAALAASAGSKDPAVIAAAEPGRVSGLYEQGRNLSNYLDFRFIPGKMPHRYYENQGLLSPLSAMTICLFGVFAGRLLKSVSVTPLRKVAWLAAGGAGLSAVGWLWSLQFPVIKNLWTSSFCLVTAGYSAILLAVFYLVVDVWKRDFWCRPFVWIGTNSITIYVGFALISFQRIAERLVGGDIKAFGNATLKGSGTLLVALMSLSLAILCLRFLYKRGIFLRV